MLFRSVSLYGKRRELWKTVWMRQAGGSCSFKLVGVVYRILKGPCRLGASLAFGCVVLMFVPSNQTICSVLKVWDAIGGPFLFITSAATFKAAKTSFWSCCKAFRRSSTTGIREARFTRGRNSGWKPYQI